MAGLDEALPQLWKLVDEAGSHGTLGLFLRMAEWIRAQSPRGEAHYNSDPVLVPVLNLARSHFPTRLILEIDSFHADLSHSLTLHHSPSQSGLERLECERKIVVEQAKWVPHDRIRFQVRPVPSVASPSTAPSRTTRDHSMDKILSGISLVPVGVSQVTCRCGQENPSRYLSLSRMSNASTCLKRLYSGREGKSVQWRILWWSHARMLGFSIM